MKLQPRGTFSHCLFDPALPQPGPALNLDLILQFEKSSLRSHLPDFASYFWVSAILPLHPFAKSAVGLSLLVDDGSFFSHLLPSLSGVCPSLGNHALLLIYVFSKSYSLLYKVLWIYRNRPPFKHHCSFIFKKTNSFQSRRNAAGVGKRDRTNQEQASSGLHPSIR